MKCIQCRTENKLKERIENQGRCKNCGHEFAFELKTASPYHLWKVTDSFFQKLVTTISVKNTLYFTSKQLFYFFNRKLKTNIFRNRNGSIGTYLFINALITFALFIEKSSNTLENQLPGEIYTTITPQEREWLEAGNFVNLESFRPQQLIQIIQRGINNYSNLSSDDSLVVAGSDTNFYGIDTFG